MQDINRKINDLSESLGAILLRNKLFITAAESCTGGGVAQAITAVPGSSQWFNCSFVTYSNASKHQMLGVSSQLIESEGAVSEAVVKAMAKGAQNSAGSDASLAVSGIAGPGGGTIEKPVGTVWIAWSLGADYLEASLFRFDGGRQSIRDQAVCAALGGIYERLLQAQPGK